MTTAAPGRRAGLAIALAVAVATGVAGGWGFTHARIATSASAAERAGTRRSSAPAGAEDEPVPSCPTAAAGCPGGSAPPDPAASLLPQVGDGRFTPVPGTGTRAGARGRLVRYQVVVEGGVPVDPTIFAAAVDRILAAPKGWTAGGRWSFQRVGGGTFDLTVHLATADTTTELCARYGLHTHGEVSCRGGPNVMINAKRWLFGVPWYADALPDYRTMLINHEVGHFLGHGHATCPGPGRLAPVMQTQTYSLGACTRNPWPYPDGSNYYPR